MDDDDDGGRLMEGSLRCGGEKGRDRRKGRLVLVRLDDVADEDDVEGAMGVVEALLEEREGRGRGLDVLVNNVGILHRNQGGVEEL